MADPARDADTACRYVKQPEHVAAALALTSPSALQWQHPRCTCVTASLLLHRHAVHNSKTGMWLQTEGLQSENRDPVIVPIIHTYEAPKGTLVPLINYLCDNFGTAQLEVTLYKAELQQGDSYKGYGLSMGWILVILLHCSTGLLEDLQLFAQYTSVKKIDKWFWQWFCLSVWQTCPCAINTFCLLSASRHWQKQIGYTVTKHTYLTGEFVHMLM